MKHKYQTPKEDRYVMVDVALFALAIISALVTLVNRLYWYTHQDEVDD